ncbi:MAG: tetratricopeptide repeat protein, partial [Mucilaginibacter polytrichastri]|nr:tetratricopeptide repeat protein [Mucilaginibacter polytrichastri]
KYALATEYLRLNNRDKALEFYEDLTANHPDYVGTYYHLGKLYEQLGRKDDALFTYKKGMDVAFAARDAHARNELQAAWNEAQGWDDDDD